MEWSASQYLRFEDERTRPARDLLAQIPLSQAETVYDLGCGPGNSTELLDARFPGAQISGMDMDEDMLAAARKRLPHIPFFKADLTSWVPEEPVDLLFSNAVFQWLPDHLSLISNLMTKLRSGGVLAIQMPDNLTEPTHRLMEETALAGPWKDRFSKGDVKRATLPPPEAYMEALSPQSDKINIWHTIYYHRLANAEAIVEWVKGTGLRPWLNRLDEADRPAYIADYTARVADAYRPLKDGSVLLKFPRLFVVGVKK
ncbi:trans-aconitate 2-methyltransferase [Rhizobium sp. L1K21]|uniref:trans-aconitate 2-methyltransferase n=1 Tax=Rhizobium sp. L1K21 TaxID=2954933 RepID=UPI0020937B98|nr:trans-aconitate 2-methyltransferase [Rhizobium sp. L1K21]MCO6185675.1 trans-aconitate 2-methyltransferase [Rhizobium sp. L1K21]